MVRAVELYVEEVDDPAGHLTATPLVTSFKLPSVKTLSQEHGVSHITAERALTTLRDEGLITAVIGKGYYVAGT